MIFLKLGGSLITDKTVPEKVRWDDLNRLASEIASIFTGPTPPRLILGHGSGSFGHVAGAKHGTRQGVQTTAEWFGFTEVSDAAMRLNRIMVGALVSVGCPAISISTASSAVVEDGRILEIATDPIQNALDRGLLPVVYGDVAFDRIKGGTILSTEEVFGFLAGRFRPSWMLLAGETDGVYDQRKVTIPKLTPGTLDFYREALGGSRGEDVTGGMIGKVEGMLSEVAAQPTMSVRIFSGLKASDTAALITDPTLPIGTELSVD